MSEQKNAFFRGPLVYLIHIPAERAGFNHWIYFDADPRPNGCTYPVVGGVELSDGRSNGNATNGPLTASYPILSRSKIVPNRYRLFATKLHVPGEFEVLEGLAFAFPDWDAFMASPIAKDSDWKPIQ